MQVLDWWMLGISIVLLIYGILGMIFSKEKIIPLGAAILGIAVELFYFGYFRQLSKPPTPIAEKQLPLTLFNSREVLEVTSRFEQVDGGVSLYVAQARRPGDHTSINHMVFLDTIECPEEEKIFPVIGEKIEVLLLQVRANGNIVTEGPSSVMAFAKMTCNSK